MIKPSYVFNVDDRVFNYFKHAVEYINCSPKELVRAIRDSEENDRYDFTINNKKVNIEIIKPKKKYVKYILKNGSFVYLLYIVDVYGESTLIKTMDKENFDKLNIENDKIEMFDYHKLS